MLNDINMENREKGFTLVELAVVMIIIGLLVGGVLKGQELINNARVTATAKELESYSGAMNGFIDKYSAVPGDMINADTRLPENCDGLACFNGNGDSRIGVSVGQQNVPSANGAAGGPVEAGNFFSHLLATDFVSGYTGTNLDQFGENFPTSPVGGGYYVGDARRGARAAAFNAAELAPRPYLLLTGVIAPTDTGNGVLTPQQAAQIDRKLDDGRASSGTVVAQASAECRDGAANANDYDEQSTAATCVIAYRLQ